MTKISESDELQWNAVNDAMFAKVLHMEYECRARAEDDNDDVAYGVTRVMEQDVWFARFTLRIGDRRFVMDAPEDAMDSDDGNWRGKARVFLWRRAHDALFHKAAAPSATSEN